MLAWRNARDTYRRSLPEKDFKRIMIPAGPEDVLEEIKKWQSRHAKSKYSKVADGVQAGISQLQKFNRAIDMIAQGSPAPGCLVWGSIIFVVTIVQNAAEEYNKLCKTLTRMTECLPRVELYTETFLHSSLVQDCVSAFYSSVLRFWARACKFYRRHRLWNFVRVVWNDYDAEFKELEVDMVRCRDCIEASALAEHIGESKVARTQQQTVNTSLLEAQSSSRQKEIIAWLAPTGYAVDYYMEDFANARAARHPNTCQWLFARDTFVHFNEVTPSSGAFLWIHAQPGAGKTVLAAFMVDHFVLRYQSGCVLFFFCKDTDEDKRTPVAIARSLLYQLFHALRERAGASALIDEISLAMDEAGHKRALSFSAVWRIFSNHISDLTPATIVVDALDECRDSEILIENLRSMACSHNVAIVMTSRKEEHIYQHLHQCPSLEVAPEDIDADIKAFVEAKIAASPRLSQPSVKQLVVKRLCESHEGMFLWVQYMVKELKSCVSLQQVEEDLRELPKGLDAVYQRILQRLQETLEKQTFKICAKVLSWVTTSLRPLKIEELRQALEYHYRSEGHSLLSTDGSFPYSDKDIELVCGSLVTVRNGTLQVVHLTVKQYIQSPSDPTILRLLAETKGASSQLTLACLSFLEHKCSEPIAKLFPARPIGAKKNKLDLSLLRSENPFLEYACFSWLVHLTDCTRIDALKVARSVHRTFDSPSTFGWIESCMALQPGVVPHLLIGLEEVRDWIHDLQVDCILAEESSFAFASNWCTTIEQVLEEYSSVLKKETTAIYYLDLALPFAAHGLTDTYENNGGLFRREICLRFPTDGFVFIHLTQKEVPPRRQLQKLSGTSEVSLGLFVYEPNRDIFIWSYWSFQNGQQVLFAQSASSGRRLPPMNDTEMGSDHYVHSIIRSYAMSEDGGHLGIVYRNYAKSEGLQISIWEIERTLDFTKRMQASSWARIIHKSTIDMPVARLLSEPYIAFDRDGVCYTPNGLVHTALGADSFSPQDVLQRLLAKSAGVSLEDECAFYSGNGKFLFVSSGTTITKYTLPGLEHLYQVSLMELSKYMPQPSPSGRYLICVARELGLAASDLARAREGTLLVDTLLSKTVVLPYSREMRNTVVLDFSVDETEIVACYTTYSSNSSYLHVYCYAGLPNEIHLRASVKLSCDPGTWPASICVSRDHKNAHLVTRSREIRRIGLGDEIEFLDAPDEMNEYPFRLDYLSRDGSQWASVHYGNDKAQIQIRKVLNPDQTPQFIELHRESSFSDDKTTFVGMSMDLSILVLGGDIYRVETPKLGQVGLIPQTLELPRELVVNQNPSTTRRPLCFVDASNSYVAFLKRNREHYRSQNSPDDLALFCIDLDKTSPPRLQPSLPEDMFDISFQFHPSLPLLILGFGLISEAGASDVTEEDVPYHVVILDMKTMSKFPVWFEKSPDICMKTRFWYSFEREVAFSSCGDFAYVRGTDPSNRFQIILDDIEISSTPCRYIYSSLAIDDAFYEMISDDGYSIHLTLTKPAPTKWHATIKTVDLPNLVYFSSFYASRCRFFLLLGRTDEENMRALIIPYNDSFPEVKEIPLTWAKARALLDNKWEDRWGRSRSSGYRPSAAMSNEEQSIADGTENSVDSEPGSLTEDALESSFASEGPESSESGP